MWQQLDSLDMGCGGGSGSNTSDMFARAGLAVSTPLQDSTTGRHLSTGLRLLDNCEEKIDYSSRKKRSLSAPVLTPQQCCEKGTQEDASLLNAHCEDVIAPYMFRDHESYSVECLDMIKFCCRNTTQAPAVEELG